MGTLCHSYRLDHFFAGRACARFAWSESGRACRFSGRGDPKNPQYVHVLEEREVYGGILRRERGAGAVPQLEQNRAETV
ncbi:hypothetical protein D1872_297590 [compost metagenome]